MTTKRLKLQCWNCPQTYFEPLEITDQQEIIVTCPYCKAEAVINLRPYRKHAKTVIGNDDTTTDILEPIPTRMPGDATTDAPPPAGDVKKKRRKGR